jgi:double-stranded uracil-DNA glycosylase
LLQSFAPHVGDAPKLLILGSMSGRLSLQQQQYYAHPQNLFWPMLSEILDFDRKLPYAQKLRALSAQHIALWDVLKHCERATSLDSDIVTASIVTNDFAAFFAAYPSLRHVLFNGSKAEQVFRRYVLKNLLNTATLQLHKLPSTSPAHASLARAQKLAQWQAVLQLAVNS